MSQQPGRLRTLLSQEDTHRRSTGQVSERNVGNSKVGLPLCPHSLRRICDQSLQPKCSPSVYSGLSWIPDNWTTPPRCPGQHQSLSRVRLCVTPMECGPSSSSVPWDPPGQNTEVGCHALLQGIFPTQGSSLGLLHCRQILHRLSWKVAKAACEDGSLPPLLHYPHFPLGGTALSNPLLSSTSFPRSESPFRSPLLTVSLS